MSRYGDVGLLSYYDVELVAPKGTYGNLILFSTPDVPEEWYRDEIHSKAEYVSAYGATVNNIEGFWNMLKRGIRGTHIHVSEKHLSKYLGEFEYRWNMRSVPHLMLDRLLHSFVR